MYQRSQLEALRVGHVAVSQKSGRPAPPPFGEAPVEVREMLQAAPMSGWGPRDQGYPPSKVLAGPTGLVNSVFWLRGLVCYTANSGQSAIFLGE